MELVLNDLDFNSSGRIINLQDATLDQSPVTFAQLKRAIEGLSPKDNVRVSTQANLNLASPGAGIDGIAMLANDRVLVRAQTAGAENGIYIWNGAAVAMTRAADGSTSDELESAILAVDEGTNAGTTWRQAAVNFVLGTGSVSWVQFGVSAVNATELVAGIIEIATQAETDAGTDDARAITALKLKNSVYAHRGAVLVIGDGTATQFDLTHNFGSRDVAITVTQTGSPYKTVNTTQERPDVNTARVRFNAAPANGAYRVLVNKI
ncbi:MAG: hypothetical protein ACRDBG_03330 [Waterburya sp.]